MSTMWYSIRSNIWSRCISEVTLPLRKRDAAITAHPSHHRDRGLDGYYNSDCFDVLFTIAYLSSELLSPPFQLRKGVALAVCRGWASPCAQDHLSLIRRTAAAERAPATESQDQPAEPEPSRPRHGDSGNARRVAVSEHRWGVCGGGVSFRRLLWRCCRILQHRNRLMAACGRPCTPQGRQEAGVVGCDTPSLCDGPLPLLVGCPVLSGLSCDCGSLVLCVGNAMS